ncbi:MAG TPA: choloylglycine hydrolase family protein [Parachlamydiaceae bacterium]|nr:choloylglycine hydrolase family protein [Parachlamydiaceae bacterium]
MLGTKENKFVHGRTLEFAIELDNSLVVIPRGYAFQGFSLNYESKYGVLGIIAFDNLAVLDGINEKGFSIGTFFFPGFAGYAKNNSNNGLSPADFPNWALTQFATIEELKTALETIKIVDVPVKGWGQEAPPFHYIVYDRTGKSLVIEPIDGELKIYENPLGVLTNSPDFKWHLTNLRNYINLTTINAKPFKFRGLEFVGFGQGSGMVGIPGDFTPPSRFVRATIYTAAAIPSNTSDEAIFQTFHILNQFDIPIGAIKEEKEGKIYTDYTMLTCVRDPENLKYYFKTYHNSTIKVADLKKFDLNAKTVKSMKMDGKEAPVDITTLIISK